MSRLYPGPRDVAFDLNRPRTWRVMDALNRSGRADWTRVRRQLKHWFDRIPDSHKRRDLAARLTSSRNDQVFEAALEVGTFAALKSSGWAVDPYPVLPSGNEADFLASLDATEMLVECASVGESERQELARYNDFVEQLERVPCLRGWRMGLLRLVVGNRVPSAIELARWICPRLPVASDEVDLGAWSADGWRIGMSAWRAKPGGGGQLVASETWAGWEQTHRIKAVLERKKRQLRSAGEPLLVVLSGVLNNGLTLGEIRRALVGQDDSPLDRRSGFWIDRGSWRRSQIVGVLFARNRLPWFGGVSGTSSHILSRTLR